MTSERTFLDRIVTLIKRPSHGIKKVVLMNNDYVDLTNRIDGHIENGINGPSHGPIVTYEICEKTDREITVKVPSFGV